MRFVFNDPYTLRGAVHEMAGSQPVATRERDLPIPGARLEDLDLSCQDGQLTREGQVAPVDRDFAIREIAGGRFSRTLALPVRRKGRRK